MSLTIREGLEAVRDWHSGDASELGCRTVAFVSALIDVLDNSREITEKVTVITPDYEHGRHDITVTNHKARVVLDD